MHPTRAFKLVTVALTCAASLGGFLLGFGLRGWISLGLGWLVASFVLLRHVVRLWRTKQPGTLLSTWYVTERAGPGGD